MESGYAMNPLEAELLEKDRELARLRAQLAASVPFGIAFQNAPLSVLTTDTQLHITALYHPRPGAPSQNFIGKRLDEVLPHDDVADVLAFGASVLASGAPARHETCVSFNGEPRWYEVLAEPIVNEGGHLAGLHVAAWEITERKRLLDELADTAENLRQTRDELTASQAALQTVINYAPVGITVADAAGRVTMSNRMAESLYRRPVPYGEDYSTHAAMDVCHLDGAPYDPRYLPLTRSALDGETVRDEELIIRWPDNQERTVSVSSVPVRDESGSIAGAVCSFEDITERRESKEELQRAHDEMERRVAERTADLRSANEALRAEIRVRKQVEQRLVHQAAALQEQSALLDLAQEAIMIRGIDGTIRYWNHGAAQCYGWSAEEAVGQNAPRLLQTCFPKPLAEINRDLLRDGRWEGEVTRTRRNGTMLVAMSRWTLQRDENGDPVVVLEISSDITEHKRMESERDAAEAALQRSHEQLQVFSRRLVEVQERERRTLARELHDQAGQSLTVLKLGLGQLLFAVPERLPAEVQGLKELVDEVMDSLHRAVLSLRPIALDRLGLAPALQQHLESLGQQTGMAVTFAAGGLDKERLPETLETAGYRIVQEALTNIVRHAGAAHISVALERAHGRLAITVEDDGAGFDVAAAQRRGRMGLLGMRERAELLGGTFAIESRPAAGTRLRVELPLQNRAEQA